MENIEKEIEERELELMNENENREFYVYVHIRLDNNTVFYVGKGTKNRAYNLSRGKGTHHDNICKACGCKVVIIKNNLTESQAFRLESKMIKYYVHTLGYGIDIEGYDDYDHKLPHLTNRSWGGEGISGLNPFANKTEEEMDITRRKMSESRKGKNPYANKTSEEIEIISNKISNSLKGKPAANRIKVICITTCKIFDCIKDAGNYYNISISNTSACCRGKRKHSGKLKDGTLLQWKYLKDYDNDCKGILINPIAE